MEQSQKTGAVGGAAQGAAAGSAFGIPGAVIGGVVGGLAGFMGGGGEKEAEQLAEEQARLIDMTAAENLRRSFLEMDSTLGLTKATTYASNLQDSGSSRQYRRAVETQFRRDMAWDQQKARIESNLARQGGQVAADQIKASGVSSMIGGITSAVGAFAPTPKTKTETATTIKKT